MNSSDINSVVNNLAKLLEPLASKLGKSAEFLYALAIRQSYAYAAADLILCAAFVGVAILAYKLSQKHTEDGWLIFIAIAFSVAALLELLFGVMRLVNPQWYAIWDLINQLRMVTQ